MSLIKPSKKHLATLNDNNNNKIPQDRPRKSFFSFKTSAKRSTSRPAAAAPPPQDNSSAPIQFPAAVGREGSSIPAQPSTTTTPPFRVDLPVRNIRSSVLFSSQFDLGMFGKDDPPIHRDPTPTPLLSDTQSRPIRSTTRPTSWMMMNDGSYAPPAKAQQHQAQSRLLQAHQHSPESFYSGTATSENRVESSDDDAAHQVTAPAASGDRKPITHQPQQQQPPLKLGGPLPASSPAVVVTSPAAPARRLQPPITILPQTDPRPSWPPVSPRLAPSGPLSPQGSSYSPLAAFLGQAGKSDVDLASKDRKNNDNNQSNSVLAISTPTPSVPPASSSSNTLLSAFFGSPSAPEKPSSKLSTSPKLVVSEAPSSERDIVAAPPAQPKKQGSETEMRTPASERSSWMERTVIKEVVTSDHPRRQPATPLTSSPSSVGKSAQNNNSSKSLSTTPEKVEPIAASPTNDRLASEPQTIPPSATPPSTSSSPSGGGDSASVRSLPPSHSPQPSTPRNNHSDPADSVSSYSLGNPPPVMQEGGGGTRKRSVEKVYVDSSSHYSSSDNYSSADEINTTEAEDRDRVTDPSSACSQSGSSPCGTPEKYKDCKPDPETAVPSQGGEPLMKSHIDDEPGQGVQAEEDDCPGGATDHVDEEEAEQQDQEPPRQQIKINFEQLVCHPDIFRKIISHLDYLDFFSLSQISREFREELEDDGRLREIIMTRYLSGFGYRSLPAYLKAGPHRARELVKMDLKDLASFYAGQEFESLELIGYAKQALNRKGLDYRTAKMIRASTRAHNKLVAYVRAVEELEPLPPNHHLNSHLRQAPRSHDPVFRSGKAALFKVWVPCVDHWMSNEELAECERELWRSQVWSYLKKGDVCWNSAIGDFGNEGKLLFDGRFLRDLLFEFDEVGHLPGWLNMLEYAPSYYHKIISSSTSAPIFYLDLTGFREEIKGSLRLSEDKIEVASPQARYRVKRWVYRAVIKIPKGPWAGQLVIEVDGTSEHARDLLRRCTHVDPAKKATPWRIIRERSRPGKLWIRPVNDDERRT